MSRTRYAVVGAGLAGAATAWQLARRGAEVTLLEAFDLGHSWGSSHGSARIIRRAYADPGYAALTGEAWSDWDVLADESGVSLVTRTGGLDFGRHRKVRAIAAVQTRLGVPHTLLSASEAGERWPQFSFDGEVLHHPDAGVVDAGLAVQTMVGRARELGAEVHTGWPVARVTRHGTGYELSSAAGHPAVRADVVVVTAGPWLGQLLPNLPLAADLLPPLGVSQQQVFHFSPREPVVPTALWPVFIDHEQRASYGLPGGSDVGPGVVKVGEHDQGPATDPGAHSRAVDPEVRDRVTAYVARRVPGLAPEPHHEGTCLYTNTPTEDFVLDRAEGLLVVSPCSGHGAKFAPTIGRIAADLATGVRSQTLPRFAFSSRKSGAGRALRASL